MTSKRELERKYREEQEATAFAFQEFIKTFQDTSCTPNKTFIKSAVLNAKTGKEIESGHGQLYNPQPFIKQTSSNESIIKTAIECARLLKDPKLERQKGQKKPKSNLEQLKDELKLRHAERGERTKLKDDSLSCMPLPTTTTSSDPNTTNLFIANINPKITEHDLMKLFGAYGPLASVKIMWPRSDDKGRTTNCGFVAFMSRKDGERAMLNLKDHDNMRVGWGKAVDLPSNPVYIPPQLLKLFLPPPCTGLPFNAQPLKQPFTQPTTEQEMLELLKNSIVKVTIPLDKKVLMIVHRVIEYVLREGPLFEAIIMNREINNPSYNFLFDNKNPVHIYYRWKLYSILQGENQKKWSTKEFIMFKDGSVWRPPIMPNYTDGMPEELATSSTKFDKSMLSDAQKSRFIELLQSLNVTKKKVGEVMVFCLNHVDAIKDIVEIVIDSFMNKDTKAPKKLSRLYLLSDVLYNSSMKKCYAPVYRTELEKHLINIFQQLNIALNNLSKEYDKNIFKTKVCAVLKAWDLWKIYSNDFLNQLENTFLGVSTNNALEDESENDEPLDGANLIKRSIKNGTNNCLVVDDSSECSQKSSNISEKPLNKLPGFIVSKWETVDPEQVEAQAMSTKKFYTMEIERQNNLQCKQRELLKLENLRQNQVDRDILRKIEVKVMQFQDDFESGKRKIGRGKSIDIEVESYRKRLIKKIKRENDEKRRDSRIELELENLTDDEFDERNRVKDVKRSKRHKGRIRGYKN